MEFRISLNFCRKELFFNPPGFKQIFEECVFGLSAAASGKGKKRKAREISKVLKVGVSQASFSSFSLCVQKSIWKQSTKCRDEGKQMFLGKTFFLKKPKMT